jgi:putative amidoligase enzyme
MPISTFTPARTYPHGRAGDAQRISDLMTMVNAGASFQEIADEIGYSTADGARRAVRRAKRAAAEASPVSMRQFGVELELKGMGVEDAVRYITAVGIDARSIGYSHSTTNYWKVLTDGSVSNGIEVVSPPLKGEAGLEELRKVMEALSSNGGSIDRECGMHVHVDMAGLNADEIIGFVGFYADRQDAIDQLVSRSRRGTANSYCMPLSRREITSALPSLRGQGSMYVDRYRKVNLMSYPRYGTVEVRHHQGTLNSKKAVAWVRMLLAMVTVGSEGTAAPLSLAGMLATLVAHGGLDRRASSYLLRRALAFGFADRVGTENDEVVHAPASDATPAQPDCTCAACVVAIVPESNPF